MNLEDLVSAYRISSGQIQRGISAIICACSRMCRHVLNQSLGIIICPGLMYCFRKDESVFLWLKLWYHLVLVFYSCTQLLCEHFTYLVTCEYSWKVWYKVVSNNGKKKYTNLGFAVKAAFDYLHIQLLEKWVLGRGWGTIRRDSSLHPFHPLLALAEYPLFPCSVWVSFHREPLVLVGISEATLY